MGLVRRDLLQCLMPCLGMPLVSKEAWCAGVLPVALGCRPMTVISGACETPPRPPLRPTPSCLVTLPPSPDYIVSSLPQPSASPRIDKINFLTAIVQVHLGGDLDHSSQVRSTALGIRHPSWLAYPEHGSPSF